MILLTSRESKEDIVAGLESGADDYLVKPFNAEELKEAYRRFVSMADRKKYITDADLLYIVESGEETPAAI